MASSHVNWCVSGSSVDSHVSGSSDQLNSVPVFWSVHPTTAIAERPSAPGVTLASLKVVVDALGAIVSTPGSITGSL